MNHAAPFSLLALLAALVLSSCQTTPARVGDEATKPISEEYHRRFLNHWQADGKIGLRYGDERANATFDWEQRNANYVIHLYGPFGSGATTVRRTSKGVTLENAERGYVGAPDPESLMRDMLGWQVPLSGMQYWLRGLTDPEAPIEGETFDEAGRLQAFTQLGWQVTFDRSQMVRGWTLPGRVRAEREDMQVTAVIKDWEVPLAPGAKPSAKRLPPPRTY